MKKLLTLMIVLTAIALMSTWQASAQNTSKDNIPGSDTLRKEVITLRDRIMGVEDRITNAENDLAKLTKIKLSGYIQAQWENYENSAAYPYNYFSLRRVRLKVQYEPVNGVIFVLQPDFVPGNITLKDAYVRVNEPWLKTFSLWAGQFNRPDYEVEYSSSSREVPERSRVIRAIYPGERAIGVKLEAAPQNIPLLFQLASFNGNENLTIKDAAGVNINTTNKDFDPFKDIMARLVYTVKLGNFGALDLGANGYYGKLRATSDTVLKSDYTVDKPVKVGSALNRNWIGGELRLYMDIWGGMAIRSEWIYGINAFPGYSGTVTVTSPETSTISGDTLIFNALTTTTTSYLPNIRRNFTGGYIYLVKNIGKRHQVAFRWDYYDPNTALKGDEIGLVKHAASSTTSVTTTNVIPGNPTVISNTTVNTVLNNTVTSGMDDIAYHTFTFAYNYFVTPNIRLQLAYEMPLNEKVGKNASGTGNVIQKFNVNNQPGTNDFSSRVPQNILTVRLQAKF